MEEAPDYKSVTAQTKYWGKFVPQLGLAGNLDFEFRIYVLCCAPRKHGQPYTWYCGLHVASKVAKRLKTQFEQTSSAAHFCKENKPLWVEVVWPVVSRAAEAYVFAALTGKLPANALSLGRLGGWTQTHSEVNEFGRAVLERERRMLTSSCLRCGKTDHFARACKASVSQTASMVYNCGHCNATLRVTSQGTLATEVTRGRFRCKLD